jgi:hypothetical protein
VPSEGGGVVRPAPNSAADFLDSGQYEAARTAERVADLRVCPSFSMGGGGVEKRGHRQERRRECGTTRLSRSRQDPGLWMVYWVPCGTLGCDDCGPWVRQRKARAYIEKIGARPLVKRVVDEAAWQAMTRRLRRAKVDYLQVPAEGGRRVVLLVSGEGEPVADTAAEVTALVTAFPAGTRRNISASKAWQPVAVPAERAEEPEGYDFAGSSAPASRTPARSPPSSACWSGRRRPGW